MCRAAGKAPREVEEVECKGAKLKLSQQNGDCDLREGSGLGWKEVAGDWECGTEKVGPMDLVSPSGFIKTRKIAH